MSAWLLLLVMAGWWLSRKSKPSTPTGRRWVIRDIHGCYLTVFDDHDGHHFVWISIKDKATMAISTQILEEYRDLLNREQPENGPFRIERSDPAIP